jgi:hypothetical protein
MAVFEGVCEYCGRAERAREVAIVEIGEGRAKRVCGVGDKLLGWCVGCS